MRTSVLRHKNTEMLRDEEVLCLQLTLRKCREKIIIGKDEHMDGGDRGGRVGIEGEVMIRQIGNLGEGAQESFVFKFDNFSVSLTLSFKN